MTAIEIDFCLTFIDANRIIADRFKEKAEVLINELEAVADDQRRSRLTMLSEVFGKLAIDHARIAREQEQDLGVICHCPYPPRPVDSFTLSQ